jgi:catechol 2,3-dioxygenase-like lactoylglutathione lyase family enzyme
VESVAATHDLYDVIVIGSGPGGASLAHCLAGAGKRLRAKLEGLLGPLGAWPHLIERRLYLGKYIPIGGTAHQSGTSLFGIDRTNSVPDLDCKAHELDNLYIADASFFSVDRRGQSDADDHRQCSSRGRQDQGAAKVKAWSVMLFLAATALLAACWPHRRKVQAQRILRVSRVVADLERAEVFYRDALTFRTVRRGRSDDAILASLGFAGGAAEEVVMRLGAQEIALVRFDAKGRPYPSGSRTYDLWFQHLAVVVNDIDAAFSHLSSQPGWRPISEGGPQSLPPANGAVRAFKFRDPDGHPLELIRFPPGEGRAIWRQGGAAQTFLGIDHSALSVSSTPRSLRFYRTLGFRIAERSLNRGTAQARLDGLSDARVRVTGLRPALASGPGLELLDYRRAGRTAAVRLNDAATDWVTLGVASSRRRVCHAVRDPDGHRLVLIDQSLAPPALPPRVRRHALTPGDDG